MKTRLVTSARSTAFAICTCVIAVNGGCMDFRLPDPDVRVVAFGSSTTAGPSSKDYHEFLRERLGEDPARFANEGNGGETTDDAIGRLRSIIALGTYPNADTILLWHGGNDIIDFIGSTDAFLLVSPDSSEYLFTARLEERLDEIQANLELEIAIAQAAGWDVFLATLFPLREQTSSCDAVPFNILLAPQAANANDYVRRVNERIRLAAANAGAVLVDIEAQGDDLTANAANYFNCNHLSAAGNKIAADIFFNAINPGGAP